MWVESSIGCLLGGSWVYKWLGGVPNVTRLVLLEYSAKMASINVGHYKWNPQNAFEVYNGVITCFNRDNNKLKLKIILLFIHELKLYILLKWPKNYMASVLDTITI